MSQFIFGCRHLILLIVIFLAGCDKEIVDFTESAILYGRVTDEVGKPVDRFKVSFEITSDRECLGRSMIYDTTIGVGGSYSRYVHALGGSCHRVVFISTTLPVRADTVSKLNIQFGKSDSLRVDGVLRIHD
jgi:hypothetical protein